MWCLTPGSDSAKNFGLRRALIALARRPILKFLHKVGPVVLLFHEYRQVRNRITLARTAAKVDQTGCQHCARRRDNHGRFFRTVMTPATGYQGISLRQKLWRIWNAPTHHDQVAYKPAGNKIVATKGTEFLPDRLADNRRRDVIRGCPGRGQKRGG